MSKRDIFVIEIFPLNLENTLVKLVRVDNAFLHQRRTTISSQKFGGKLRKGPSIDMYLKIFCIFVCGNKKISLFLAIYKK